MQRSYKVDLHREQHIWCADVEATMPEPRVLLRNEVNINLEAVLDAIRNSISRHALNPWGGGGGAEPRQGGGRGAPPSGFGRHM